MKLERIFSLVASAVLLFSVFSGCRQQADSYTRGVGVYPGNPEENFSPELVPEKDNYRNIARNRAAYHSSGYDYNLTAQLITDGIVTSGHPAFTGLKTQNGDVAKNEREWLFDHNRVTQFSTEGENIFLQLELDGNYPVPEIDRISLTGTVSYDGEKPGGWEILCQGSLDGETWEEISREKGSGLVGEERPNPFARFMAQQNDTTRRRRRVNPFMQSPYGDGPDAPRPSFSFNFGPQQPQRIINEIYEPDAPLRYRYYKISFSTSNALTWTFNDFDFYAGEIHLKMAPSKNFHSAWMSGGTEEEWVYVDLGTSSKFDLVKLYWIDKPVSGKVQVSNNAQVWADVAALPRSSEITDEILLKKPVEGRYVRVLMKGDTRRFVLSEMEVYGKGGLLPKPKESPKIQKNRMDLAGGNWKIQRSSEVSAAGETISKTGFESGDWIFATVPATVLMSYRNAGAIPDPNFGDNQLMISESFFYADFWYRNEFDVPEDFKTGRMFLNFDGINWKADVFVNGTKAGKIEGAFIRGKFDVSDLLIPGQKNALAVLIHKNDNPGVVKEQTQISPDKNGGVLGADNPTYHASIGWDWIPTIRGRNTGIWNDVYITATGPVTIENPFVTTDLPLPDTSSAELAFDITLQNHTSEPVSGTLKGKYGPVSFSEEVALGTHESKRVQLNPATHPALRFENPKLWWPKGYGAPNLYEMELVFETENGVSDVKQFQSGVREMSFNENDEILSLYINGRRFIGRGGNWGFPESNLQYRAREYDIAVALHADMNFTMIRNWVGQTGDDELYEACDRHGIMIWQDFWLANPADGPNPDDPEMFMKNADDMIKRIRNHSSVAIYCGRNEGNPPEVIDTALRALIPKVHPGMHYISHSSQGVVSGGGPYRALPVRDYFLLYGFNKFHSERGMPNVMTYESLKQTLPEDKLWPQNNQWGLHDYCLEGAQGAASFNEIIDKAFGPVKDAKRFTELAQWINYNGYRGIFEGRSLHRKGMLLWMSHPAWPSMVWQTYDYYFDPTAAYFGCKKASEPLHVQWNPVFNDVEVVNYSGGTRPGLNVKAQLINMDGSVQWENEATVDSREDSTVQPFRLEFPETLSEVHFIKLTLTEGGKVVSDNFYWRGLEEGNYRALNNVPVVQLENSTVVSKSGDSRTLTTTLKNTTETPVLMVRLKVTGSKSGERILPVFFSDNFVSLLPGEEKVITMNLKNEDTRGEKPVVEISGFNL